MNLSLDAFIALVQRAGPVGVIAVLVIACWLLYTRRVRTKSEYDELRQWYTDEITRARSEAEDWQARYFRAIEATRGNVVVTQELLRGALTPPEPR